MAEICIICGQVQQPFSQAYPEHTTVRLVPSPFHDEQVRVYPATSVETAAQVGKRVYRSRPATLGRPPGIVAEVSIHQVCFRRVSRVRGGMLADKIAAIALRRNMR